MAVVTENIYQQKITGSVAEAEAYQRDLLKYINILFHDRKIYLFDSFEGFDKKRIDAEMDNKKQMNDWTDTLKDTSQELVISK